MKDTTVLRAALLQHYDQSARDLPWRNNHSPYAVWVSEVMLQQTRVATVVSYFVRWMARFPSVEALARADVDDVLELWAGLGYYSRARNLHRGAVLVSENFQGELPRSVDDLRSIPGIGDYTAGAIASIAFGLPEPAVDGNVRRVLARLFDLEVTTPDGLKSLASGLQDPERPGDFNQALMEFGAVVCTPRRPGCTQCPLAESCGAFANNTVDQRPTKRRPSPKRQVSYRSYVALDGDKNTLLVKRPDKGLLAGMWEFPSMKIDEPVQSGPGLELPPVLHEFTHLRATYRPFVLEGARNSEDLQQMVEGLDLGGRATRIHRLDRLDSLAVSSGQLKIAKAALQWCRGPSTDGD